MEKITNKPTHPCSICHTIAWYWPGDYYAGKKKWLCGICHPAPQKKVAKKKGKKGKERNRMERNRSGYNN